MRIPLTPHEIGDDSFLIHFLADSISTYGHAKWWINPLSIVGLYPFSYASAMLFYLSGASQSLSLAMEQTIWVVLLSLGIFSSFTAYLMAGAIKDDEIFKFITALVYSTSPGILIFTTWNASTRSMFFVILPLFIYLLIKSRFFRLKYGLFAVVLFIVLFATHNLFYLVIMIILSYVIATIISNIQFKSSNFFGGIVLLILFVIFFMQLSIDEVAIDTLIKNYARYIGVMGIFILGGFISILFKNNKTFEESFIILVILFLLPFVSVFTYGKFFMLPFEALLISFGIVNLIKISQNRKGALYILMILMILSIGFAEFYQFGRTNIGSEEKTGSFWAEESTVNAALWTKSNINKLVYADDTGLSRKVLAYSGATMLSESDIVHLIQGNLGDFKLSMRSFSTALFSDGPYQVDNQIGGLGSWIYYKLREETLDSRRREYLTQASGINYYIKNEKLNSEFSRLSKINDKDKVFDNGEISIWNNIIDNSQIIPLTSANPYENMK
jgi:hypothetical protein